MWEEGGGWSNTGSSTIICDRNGLAKKAIYVRKRGSLACEKHALIPIIVGDVVIKANHHRRDFDIDVKRIVKIPEQDDENEIQFETINSFSCGEWDSDIERYKDAVDAAMEKATIYHCRHPLFIKKAK